MNKIVKIALLNALGIAVYVILIASFFSFMQINFKETPDAFIAPIVMLLLLIFSAAITGFLVFGKPAMLYIDGKRKEALTLLGWTLFFIFVIIICVLVILITK